MDPVLVVTPLGMVWAGIPPVVAGLSVVVPDEVVPGEVGLACCPLPPLVVCARTGVATTAPIAKAAIKVYLMHIYVPIDDCQRASGDNQPI